MTNIEKLIEKYPFLKRVMEWRKDFDLPISHEQCDDEYRKLSDALVLEEETEYNEASENKDKIEILDAIGDLAFVCTQAAIAHNLDVDNPKGSYVLFILSKLEEDAKVNGVDIYTLINEIADSNYSKLVKDTEILLTEQKYATLNTPVYFKYVKSNLFKVLRSSDGKVLKGINFVEPNIKKLINE